MREILFRGKRLDNGEWVYGSFLQVEHEDGSFTTAIFHKKDAGGDAEVSPATVGQYTGLKDKHGKRIFEGDIVRCGTGRICKVIFFISPGVSGFDLVPVGGFDAPPPHNWSLFADTEIIGNVHDNPELLDASRCLECLKGAKNKSCLIYKEGCSCGTQDDIKCLQQPAKGE